jgi:hypothetical protein
MKHLSLNLMFGVLAVSALSASAFAASPSPKMTCEEFIALDEVSRPKVVYWAEGYNWYGQPRGEFVDLGETDRLVPVVYDECTKNPKHKLISKVKAAHKKAKT